MYCSKCGKQISENAQFCKYCGFNQNDDVINDNEKSKNEEKPISWYQLDKYQQKLLKKEFKAIYPPNTGLEVLVVILYILGAITGLFCVGFYTIRMYDQTIATGTFISVPMLIITLFLFTVGTVAGLSSNNKFDKAFSQWLLTKNIVK